MLKVSPTFACVFVSALRPVKNSSKQSIRPVAMAFQEEYKSERLASMTERQKKHYDVVSVFEDNRVVEAMAKGQHPHAIFDHRRRPHDSETLAPGATTYVHPSMSQFSRRHVVSSAPFVPQSLKRIVSRELVQALPTVPLESIVLVRRCYPSYATDDVEPMKKTLTTTPAGNGCLAAMPPLARGPGFSPKYPPPHHSFAIYNCKDVQKCISESRNTGSDAIDECYNIQTRLPGTCFGVIHVPPCLPLQWIKSAILPLSEFFTGTSPQGRNAGASPQRVGIFLLNTDECNVCGCDQATFNVTTEPLRIIFDVLRPLSPAMEGFLVAARSYITSLSTSGNIQEQGELGEASQEVQDRRKAFYLCCWAASSTFKPFTESAQWSYRIEPRAWDMLRPLLVAAEESADLKKLLLEAVSEEAEADQQFQKGCEPQRFDDHMGTDEFLEASFHPLRGKAADQPGWIPPPTLKERDRLAEAPPGPKFGCRFARQAAVFKSTPGYHEMLQTNQSTQSAYSSTPNDFTPICSLLPLFDQKWSALPSTHLLGNRSWITKPRMMCQEMQYGKLELFV